MKELVTYETQAKQGILLNANENTKGLSPAIMQEISQAVLDLQLNRYPDTTEEELLNAYAKVIGITPDHLLAGNGSDQMLGYLIGTYLGKGKILFTALPDFSMYDYYASSYEAEVVKYPLREDGSFDIDAFIEEGKKLNAGLVVFSNPNNPSGHCLSLEEVRKIAEGFADIPVVADEAYIEFSDAQSAAALIDEIPNLFVTRTLSKAYGLAGIRTGFMVGPVDKMKKLKAGFVPYALNTVSMKIAVIVLSHAEEVLTYAEETKRERRRVYNTVREYRAVRFQESQANFLFGRCAQKEALLKAFDEAGIVIRNYAGNDSFRITIGTPEENDRVLAVLKTFEEEYGV